MLAVAALGADAQQQARVFLFKNDGRQVSTKDSADYIRVIEVSTSQEGLYDLREYYADGKKKAVGMVSSFTPVMVYEGPFMQYNPKGIRVSWQNYEKGKVRGAAYRYFDNGALESQTEYASDGVTAPKLIYLADAPGHAMVEEGNGHAIIKEAFGPVDSLTEEGDYKGGYKQGLWKGKYTSSQANFTEHYENDRLLSGESVLAGKKYPYKTKLELPVFAGGPGAWAAYLGEEMKYPKEARALRLEGTVHTSFTIEKDGSISEIAIVSGVHPLLDAEARRILEKAPKWHAGKQRGLPIRLKYNQAFKFRMP